MSDEQNKGVWDSNAYQRALLKLDAAARCVADDIADKRPQAMIDSSVRFYVVQREIVWKLEARQHELLPERTRAFLRENSGSHRATAIDDGLACIVCGGETGPMVPHDEGPRGARFRHEACAPATADDVKRARGFLRGKIESKT